MNKKKIFVAITARPSYSRIRTALAEMNAVSSLNVQIACSGSSLLDRYGRVVDLIKKDGFNVIEEFYTFVEGNNPVNMALTTANTVQHTALLLNRYKPDYVITVADRYETIGTAIAASYLGIPLIHIQGGEITGNIDERVRHANTKLADLHLVANLQARDRVIKMGEHPDTVFVTGCPSIDIARESQDLPLELVQKAIDDLGVGHRVDISKEYIVLLQHPETDSYEESFDRMNATLHAVSRAGLPILIFWPNVDAGSDATSKAIRIFRESNTYGDVRYVKNLEGHLFLRLLNQSKCLIGNSSVGIRECAYMGTPVVNIGNRQIGRERAKNVIDCLWEEEAIFAAIQKQLLNGNYDSSTLYGDGYAGKEIANVIEKLTYNSELKKFYE